MNDSNLCYKKFMANYGYLLYIFKGVGVWTDNSDNICCVKCVNIGFSLSLFQKKNKTENVKMLLQNTVDSQYLE